MKTDSKRLHLLSEKIPLCNRILDIGCDHGILEKLLAEKYPDMNIIASDKSLQALQKTKSLVKELGLSDRISCRRGDGFAVLGENEQVDCTVIAGIGGYVIAGILEKGIDYLDKVNEFYFLPSTDAETLRAKLPEFGLMISDEWTVKEQNRIYVLIQARHGEELHTKTTDFQYGYHLIEKKDKLLFEYLRRRQTALEKALKMIKGTENQNRIESLQRELNDTEELIAYVGGLKNENLHG